MCVRPRRLVGTHGMCVRPRRLVGTHGLCVRCIKCYSVMFLTGTDAQTVRPYRIVTRQNRPAFGVSLSLPFVPNNQYLCSGLRYE